MLGASKLKIEQVEKIKQLISENKKDQEIAEIFNVSRIMINRIRNGKRWASERDKIKIQTDELQRLPKIDEEIPVVSKLNISSVVSPVITPNGKLYVVLHYIENKLTSERFSGLFDEIPTKQQLQKIHNKFKSKIC